MKENRQTVIVALGGTGSKVLGRIRELIAGQYPGEIPTFLAIDVDAPPPSEPKTEGSTGDLSVNPSTTLRLNAAWLSTAQVDLLHSLNLPLIEVSGSIDKATVKDIYDHPDRLVQMTDRNFEFFIRELFQGLGYKVRVTPATRDGGIDIVAEKSVNGMLHRYAIQCKHSRHKGRKLGVASLRALMGAIANRAITAGIIVTNILFSKDARRFLQKHRTRLFGHDIQGLRELMKEYLRTAMPLYAT